MNNLRRDSDRTPSLLPFSAGSFVLPHHGAYAVLQCGSRCCRYEILHRNVFPSPQSDAGFRQPTQPSTDHEPLSGSGTRLTSGKVSWCLRLWPRCKSRTWAIPASPSSSSSPFSSSQTYYTTTYQDVILQSRENAAGIDGSCSHSGSAVCFRCFHPHAASNRRCAAFGRVSLRQNPLRHWRTAGDNRYSGEVLSRPARHRVGSGSRIGRHCVVDCVLLGRLEAAGERLADLPSNAAARQCVGAGVVEASVVERLRCCER